MTDLGTRLRADPVATVAGLLDAASTGVTASVDVSLGHLVPALRVPPTDLVNTLVACAAIPDETLVRAVETHDERSVGRRCDPLPLGVVGALRRYAVVTDLDDVLAARRALSRAARRALARRRVPWITVDPTRTGALVREAILDVDHDVLQAVALCVEAQPIHRLGHAGVTASWLVERHGSDVWWTVGSARDRVGCAAVGALPVTVALDLVRDFSRHPVSLVQLLELVFDVPVADEVRDRDIAVVREEVENHLDDGSDLGRRFATTLVAKLARTPTAESQAAVTDKQLDAVRARYEADGKLVEPWLRTLRARRSS